jgi:hypothetical protein
MRRVPPKEKAVFKSHDGVSSLVARLNLVKSTIEM